MALKNKKKKPKFNPMNLGFMKSVKPRWRRPRGVDNKQRIRCRFAGAVPRIGYKNAAAIRGLRADGSREMLVNNMAQLNDAKKGNMVGRIASAVGKKKRIEMIAMAHQLGVKIINA